MADVADFSRDLGIIIGQLKDVARRLDSADANRKEMYGRFDKHNAEVAELRNEIKGLDGRLKEAETNIEEILEHVKRIETYEVQGRTLTFVGGSAWKALKWLAITIGGLVITFWREILSMRPV